MEGGTFGHVTDWNEVIKKEVRGLNDANLGEVLEIREDIIVTERGTLKKEKFYLPKSISHGFDGHTLVVDITEEEAKNKFMTGPALTQETETQSTTFAAPPDIQRPIPVIEEELELTKKETIEEAKVIKKPKIEFKTVEVELTHEELVIEKRSIQDNTTSSSYPTREIVQSKTEITIPLKREDIMISKKPHVKEEIVIKKVPVSETKKISEQLISEKLSIRNDAGEEVKEVKEGEGE
jgi:uncharacterized protein (TIGR02271 family)